VSLLCLHREVEMEKQKIIKIDLILILCIAVLLTIFFEYNRISFPIEKKDAVNIAIEYLKEVDRNPYFKADHCTAIIEREDSWVIKVNIPDKGEDVERANKEFLVVVDKHSGEIIVGPYK